MQLLAINDANSVDSDFTRALIEHCSDFQIQFTAAALHTLSKYYNLVKLWNPRLHLVAPCSPIEFAKRHVLESLLLVHHVPPGATVSDIGSGAGFPIIPCLIVRPDVRAVLIESSKKKAIFLDEALRETGNRMAARVISERFENIATPQSQFVTCRAIERFEEKLPQLINWSPKRTTLLFFGGPGLRTRVESTGLPFTVIPIPGSDRRLLLKIKRS